MAASNPLFQRVESREAWDVLGGPQVQAAGAAARYLHKNTALLQGQKFISGSVYIGHGLAPATGRLRPLGSQPAREQLFGPKQRFGHIRIQTRDPSGSFSEIPRL
jgi:hypothetical protein